MKTAGGGINSLCVTVTKLPPRSNIKAHFGSQFGAQPIAAGKAAGRGGNWPQGILSQEAETNAGTQLAFHLPVVGAPAGGMVLPFSVDLPSSRSEPRYAHSGAQRLVYLVTLELVKLTTSIVTVTVWLSKKMLSLTGP